MYYPDLGDMYAQRESGPPNYRINSDIDPPTPSTLTISDLRGDPNDFPLVSVVISK